VAELGDRRLDVADALLEAARHPQGPDAVAEVAAQLTEDGRAGEGGERDAAVGVESLQSSDEAERSDLDEVLGGLDAAAVTHRQAARKRQETPDDLLTCGLIARLRVFAQQRGLIRETFLDRKWHVPMGGLSLSFGAHPVDHDHCTRRAQPEKCEGPGGGKPGPSTITRTVWSGRFFGPTRTH
jgi:hypothetical protein